MATDKEVKLEFIKETLFEHGEELVDLLEGEIWRKKLIRSDKLRSEISFAVNEISGEPRLQLAFRTYGRLIEIRFHRKQKVGTSHRRNLQEMTDALRGNRATSTRRKNTAWYSKTAYGTLNNLIAKLMYGFSDEVQRGFRTNLDAGIRGNWSSQQTLNFSEE